MTMLYIIKRSPFQNIDLERIALIAQEGAHIMLIQDAVLTAADSEVNRRMLDRFKANGVSVHALREDLSARGVKRTLDGVDVVDYGGWIDLVEAHNPVSF
jgi:tRNA 2-thiouridine synthesizing protein B